MIKTEYQQTEVQLLLSVRERRELVSAGPFHYGEHGKPRKGEGGGGSGGSPLPGPDQSAVPGGGVEAG